MITKRQTKKEQCLILKVVRISTTHTSHFIWSITKSTWVFQWSTEGVFASLTFVSPHTENAGSLIWEAGPGVKQCSLPSTCHQHLTIDPACNCSPPTKRGTLRQLWIGRRSKVQSQLSVTKEQDVSVPLMPLSSSFLLNFKHSDVINPL